jgi:hypothetical protein
VIKRELMEALAGVPDDAEMLIDTDDSGSALPLKQVSPLMRCSDEGPSFDYWNLDDAEQYSASHPTGADFEALPYSVILYL